MTDTICAISTPAGVGGIAVCRVSGSEALPIVSKIWSGTDLASVPSHSAHLGTVLDDCGDALDQAVATVFRSPRSFTAEDTVEISVHGSIYIQQAIIASLIKAGARLAQPGEFTRRAFIAGRFDLAQAEAVADLISSTSRAAQRLALSQMRGSVSKRLEQLRTQLVDLASLVELELDFSEEEVEFASREHLRKLASEIYREVSALHATFATGQAIKNGIPVAIVGPTNAGKSSLLNALTGDDRAIVSDIHGTTRDTIEDTLSLPSGHQLRLIDTAGLRHTTDTIEQLGIDRSIQSLRRASIILALLSATEINAKATSDKGLVWDLLAQIRSEAPETPVILLLNKTDLLSDTKSENKSIAEKPCLVSEKTGEHTDKNLTVIPISVKNGDGLDTLRTELQRQVDLLTKSGDTDGIIITNARHAQALGDAAEALRRTLDALDQNLSGDLLAIDIRQAIHHLATLTGAITTDTLLSTIFTRFCIGK